MSDEEATLFLERISATAIVNQAVWRCLVARLPPDRENIMLCVEDFIGEHIPLTEGLRNCINRAIEEILSTAEMFAKARGRIQ